MQTDTADARRRSESHKAKVGREQGERRENEGRNEKDGRNLGARVLGSEANRTALIRLLGIEQPSSTSAGRTPCERNTARKGLLNKPAAECFRASRFSIGRRLPCAAVLSRLMKQAGRSRQAESAALRSDADHNPRGGGTSSALLTIGVETKLPTRSLLHEVHVLLGASRRGTGHTVAICYYM